MRPPRGGEGGDDPGLDTGHGCATVARLGRADGIEPAATLDTPLALGCEVRLLAVSELVEVLRPDAEAALQQRGERVVVVGDGVSDAPVLTRGRLLELVAARRSARPALHIVRQNFTADKAVSRCSRRCCWPR